MSLEYIKHRQRQWQRKMRRAAKLEAEKEASRVAKMEAEARKQEEIAARKRLLSEQQEAERLHQKHIQRKEKIAEQKWNEQLDALLTKVDHLQREDDKLDEIAFYKEEKSASWVANVYDGGTSYNHTKSGGSGLVGYWRFNEGSGTTVKDLSGYGHHGTLTNASYGTSIDGAVDSLPPSGTPTWIKPPTGYDQ